MSRRARGFWWWTSVLLVSTAVAGAFFPRAATGALLAQFVFGLMVGMFGLLWPPSGPDAVHMGWGNGRCGR